MFCSKYTMPQVLGTSKAIGGFDPLSIGGCQLWLDAADSTTITGTTTVTSWKDKSSRNYNLVPGTGTTSYAGNAVTITASYLYATGAVDLTTFTCFIVAKNNNTTNNQPIFTARPNTLTSYNSTDGFSFYMDTGTKTRFYGGSTTTGQQITTAVTTSVVNLYSFTGTITGFFNQWTNARQVGAATYTTRTSTAQGFSIGGEWSGTAYTAYASTANSIYEILVYNSVLPAHTRQAVENYLARKWSITIGSLLLTSPLDIPGCAMWFDAADPSTFTPANPTNGTTITQWNDKSSNANHLVKGSTGAPTYQVAGFNSMPALYFNATTTQWMQSATAVNFQTAFSPSNGDTTRFMVFSQTGGTCGGMWFQWTGQAGGSDGVQAFGGANLCMSIYGTNIQLTNASNQPLLVSYVVRVGNSTTKDSTDLYCYASNVTGNPVSNLSTVPSALATWNFTEKAVIGAKDSNGNYGATGYHCEYIVYNQALSPAQSNSVLYYLAAKWGMNTSVSARTPGTIIPFLSKPLSRGFVPLDIPGCAVWLDAADTSTLTLSGNNVSQWRDKSGLGNNATAGGTGSPVLTQNAINGNQALYMNLNPYFRGPISLTGTTVTCFAVVLQTALPTDSRIITLGTSTSVDYDAGHAIALFTRQSTGNLETYRSGIVATVTATQNVGYLAESIYDGTNGYLYRNGTVAGSNASTGNFSVSLYGLGTRPDVSSTEFWQGYFGEFLIYTTALTTTQRQQIEGYLAAKWGLLSSVVSGHPFKSIPPSTASQFSPFAISGLALWLDASDASSITLTGSTVNQWNDKSGNARHFTQGTTASQPTYGTYLSYPGLYFNGANLMSNAYSHTGIFGRNTFIVFYDSNTAGTIYGDPPLIYMGGTGTGDSWRTCYIATSDALCIDMGTGAKIMTATSAVTTMRSLRCIAMWAAPTGATVSTTYVYGNGTQFTTQGVNSTGLTTAMNTNRSGGTSIGGGSGGNTTSVISEIIHYSFELSSNQRQAVEGYLAWKWGLQSKLPTTHPFYKFAPGYVRY